MEPGDPEDTFDRRFLDWLAQVTLIVGASLALGLLFTRYAVP